MRPATCEEFEVAILCALPHEADAVKALCDETYDDDQSHVYSKPAGDANVYSNCRVGQHSVVLCYMPGMGKGSAAGVASNLRMTYPVIQLALVVGICGAVPVSTDGSEIVLGDVIISDSLIEYDFGRQYPDGFMRKHDAKTLPTNDRSICCWDIISGACKQTIEVDEDIYHLAFSDNHHLSINQRLVKDISSGTLEISKSPGTLAQKLQIKYDWIGCDNQKLIWVPPGYRILSHATYNSTHALGHSLGPITFLEFDI